MGFLGMVLHGVTQINEDQAELVSQEPLTEHWSLLHPQASFMLSTGELQPGCSQMQEAVLDEAKGVAAVPWPCVSSVHAGAAQSSLLYPGRVGSPYLASPGCSAWLQLSGVRLAGPARAQAPLAPPAPHLGKHPRHGQLGTHAPHSTFRERMLSKPHSMMFGQAEVNSILLPWKFSWSYTVIWNRERAAKLRTARQWPRENQHLFKTEGHAPFGEEPAGIPGPAVPCLVLGEPHAGPCSALLLTPAEISPQGSSAVRSRSGTGGRQSCGWHFSRPLL